jgi:hypothetical protein
VIALATVVGAEAYVSTAPNNECWAYVGSTAWVPLVGPLVAVAGLSSRYQSSNHSPSQACPMDTAEYLPGVALAIIDTVLQVGGATMLILGFVLKKEEIVKDRAQSSILGVSPEWAVRVGAPGAPLGLTFSITKF